MLITKCLLLFLFLYGKNIVESTDTSAASSPSSVACVDSDSKTGGSDSGFTSGKEVGSHNENSTSGNDVGSDDQNLTASGANEVDGSTGNEGLTAGKDVGSDDQGSTSGTANGAGEPAEPGSSSTPELKVFKTDSNNNPVQIEPTEFYKDQYLNNLTYALKPGVKSTLVKFGEAEVWKKGDQQVDEPKSVTYNFMKRIVVRNADKSVVYKKDNSGTWVHHRTIDREKQDNSAETGGDSSTSQSGSAGSRLSSEKSDDTSTGTPEPDQADPSAAVEASEEKDDDSSQKEADGTSTVASPDAGSTNEVSTGAGLRGTSVSAEASEEADEPSQKEDEQTSTVASSGGDTTEKKEKEPDEEKEASTGSDDPSSSHVGAKSSESTDPGVTAGGGDDVTTLTADGSSGGLASGQSADSGLVSVSSGEAGEAGSTSGRDASLASTDASPEGSVATPANEASKSGGDDGQTAEKGEKAGGSEDSQGGGSPPAASGGSGNDTSGGEGEDGSSQPTEGGQSAGDGTSEDKSKATTPGSGEASQSGDGSGSVTTPPTNPSGSSATPPASSGGDGSTQVTTPPTNLSGSSPTPPSGDGSTVKTDQDGSSTTPPASSGGGTDSGTKTGSKTGVELSLKDKKATDQFDRTENDKVVTFTAKDNFGFSSVKTKTGGSCGSGGSDFTIWDAKDASEYASKVVLNGKGKKDKTVTITLVNGTTKSYKKDGKNKPWREVSQQSNQETGQSDGNKGIKLLKADPSDANKTIELGTSEYKVKKVGDDHLYTFNNGVKCTLLKIDDKDVWKYNSSKHNDKYPKVINVLKKRVLIYFENGSEVYTKGANGWSMQGTKTR